MVISDRKLLQFFFLIFLSLVILFLFGKQVVRAEEGEHESRPKHPHQSVCQGGEQDSFHCSARVIVDDRGAAVRNLTPVGYDPAQFLGGYNLSGNTSSNQIIAIVDAYDNPYALSDLNYYSKTFGIPQLASCPVSQGTLTHPCFQKVNQNGGTSFPRANSGWALEISLDLQTAHAICQNCNILLVEARSASYSDLMAAVDRARLMGAKIISNSYGSGEFSSETSFDSHFNYPGVMFLFSSGDGGFGTGYPAASQYVTAVGGTSLFLNSNNSYQSESAWSGSGSGCSLYEAKPSWQKDPLCAKRTIADVSADADPNTGAAVYDSFGYGGVRGWFQVGGTSLSSPLIAGVYALAGGVPATTLGAALPYSLVSYASNLNDVTVGNNGSCGGSYLCTAASGFDGPTGLGTPKGTSAF